MNPFASLPSLPSGIATAVALLALCSGPVAAQGTGTAPAAKPAGTSTAKPAAGAATKPAAAAAPRAAAAEANRVRPGEKLMTREELRACLKRSDDLVAGRKVLEERQAESQKVRLAIEDEGQQLKAEREALQADANAQMQAFRVKVDALNVRIKAHSELAADVNENRRILRGEQQRQFENERVALQSTGAQLNAERDELVKTLEERNRAFNARASARDARVTEWNVSNNKLLDELRAAENEAEAWRRECGNRPYREEDEQAIRAGK